MSILALSEPVSRINMDEETTALDDVMMAFDDSEDAVYPESEDDGKQHIKRYLGLESAKKNVFHDYPILGLSPLRQIGAQYGLL